MMKKIAGITWWKGNYGSILQAYALGKVIERIGDVDYEILRQYTVNSFSIPSLLKYIKAKGFIETIKDAKKKYGNRSLRDRKRKCEEFIRNNMRISSRSYSADDRKSIEDDYDGFICGSDQIWNPVFTSRSGIYWLGFSNHVLKIAYAPSIGITDANEVMKEEIRCALQSFKAISCRENEGTKLINSIMGEGICQTVLDPTLLLTRKEWDSLVTDSSIKDAYVFSYILRGTDEQRKMVKRFAKENGLRLVTIPFLEAEYRTSLDGKYADINFTDASPIDFISLIKNATYVFTDSFHCMIFSCIFHRTFFSLKKTGKNQMLRINDFQSWLNIGNRVIENYDDILRLLETDMDSVWINFENRVCEERKKSLEYLHRALS